MSGITEILALPPKIQVHRPCDERFAPVRDAFAHNLETAQDIGASVALFVDGEAVRDKRALDQAIGPNAEIYVMQALSGG